jgi:ABC-2 type transport system permease protein
MNTMKWLLRRELWENNGSFVRVPVIIALTMLAFLVCMAGYGMFHSGFGDSVTVNGHAISKVSMWNAMPLERRTEIAHGLAGAYIAFAAPLFLVLPLVTFFYCLAALYDDRRDRSILFWKSLPISDQSTVLSKVLTALCVAPLITMAVGTAAALTMLLIGVAMASLSGLHIAGMLLTSSEFYLAPLRLLGLLPVYMLWAIPTVGWLLMVSSWARSKVFLWAVGIPLLGLLLVQWFNFMSSNFLGAGLNVKLFQHIVARALGGLIPGIWMKFANVSPETMVDRGTRSIDAGGIFSQSWMTLLQPEVWVGVIAGAAMIYVAMRLRRWRDEG